MTGEPTSDILRARDHFRKAEVILSKTPEGQAVARLYIGITQTAFLSQRSGEGLVASKRAMEIAERLHDQPLRAEAAACYGLHLHMRGRLAESRAVLEQAWQTAFRLNVTAVAFVATWTGGGRIGFDHDSPEVRRSDSAIRGRSMLDSLCREPSRCPFAPSPVKKEERHSRDVPSLSPRYRGLGLSRRNS